MFFASRTRFLVDFLSFWRRFFCQTQIERRVPGYHASSPMWGLHQKYAISPARRMKIAAALLRIVVHRIFIQNYKLVLQSILRNYSKYVLKPLVMLVT